MERLDFSGDPAGRQKWWVCVMLFLATMMMYMDRQVLAQSSVIMTKQGIFTDQGYGDLEKYFSYAFAIGSIFTGLLADRVNVRILYPLLLVGWSLAGVFTPYSQPLGAIAVQLFGPFLSAESKSDPQISAYAGLLICRIMLGIFEAGHWPCALITTKLLLEGKDRTLGNSILQSGATIGTILTPLAILGVQYLGFREWGMPFVVIGVVGLAWVIPWWITTMGLVLRRVDKPRELQSRLTAADTSTNVEQAVRRIIALAVVVTVINLTWQVFRAWLPKMINIELASSSDQERDRAIALFPIAYFLLADIGCIMAGAISKFLAHKGMSTHSTRLAVYVAAAIVTACGGVFAAYATGYGKLGMLLLVGLGSLALFPTYYSLSQDITAKHQGFVTGIFSAGTWFITGYFQGVIGEHLKTIPEANQGTAYSNISLWMSLIPLIGALAIWLLWKPVPGEHLSKESPSH